MKLHLNLVAICLVLISGCAVTTKDSRESRIVDVTAAEIAFAEAMAKRDHYAFLSFITAEAVFLNGGEPLGARQKLARTGNVFIQAQTRHFHGSQI